ncbi:AAEL004465-PB [Aedes aegypti]|uniref:AAEL004465-PA n=2 Tax=Aedes aegypti TaxID=7159 RepID=Q17CP6_AEDAE|nr:iron-sulfur cluster co-chaperone protein HscB, mitochondrial [Aedes aegypti]XP_011493246.1 iron-sulfur cluster co-chaperone protein HscB, mitochondrial [Aedes aegypti]EAT44150.1 AAEL004465-PA [Aedes aegypti]EJY57535.1 AAEL004465-PB [Aedes aegypti]
MIRLPVMRYLSFLVRQTANNGTTGRMYCTTAKFCWSCSKPLVKKDKFFCGSCGSLQRVEEVDYFKLLDVSNEFDLDPFALTSNFRRLQSMLHPDKFSRRSNEEKTNSLEWSSLVNKAYKTLNTPLQRGRYILKQNGILISEENTSVDPEFLMDMMDKNEAVEEASNYDDLDEIGQTLKAEIDELYEQLNKSFLENNLDEAKENLIRLKYLLNIEAVVKEKLLHYKVK